ncbi:tetratricopeptide repeat protein [Saccharothrix stipae]
MIQAGNVGQIVVSDTSAPFRLTRLANESDEQQPFGEVRQLSELLLARRAVVGFTGRAAELAKLREWRDRVIGRAVCVLHGRGGQGKTRLAQHFAAESAAAGWAARQAVRRHSGRTAYDQDSLQTGQPTLVVVDYAERWPTDDLLRLLGDLNEAHGDRLRVLLIARTAGAWWADMRHELYGLGYVCGSQPLSDLPPAVDRQEVFAAARQHFAARLGVDPDSVPVPADLDGEGFGLMLSVQMAALVAVDAQRRGVRPPTDAAELSTYLLDRERSQWAALHRNRVITADSTAMARMVLVATLVRACREDVGVTALLTARVTTNPDTARSLLVDHAVPYPPRDRSTVLESLYPDRLAEDFLALSVPGHDHTEQYDSPWSLTAISGLLAPADESGSPPTWARETLVGLVEAAHRWPHLVGTALTPTITAHPRLALIAGNATLERLATLPDLPIAMLDAIHGVLPPGRHTDLDAGIARLETVRVDHHLSKTIDPAERAHLQVTLAKRLSNAGRHAAALVRAKTALKLYEGLDVSHPARLLGIGQASNNCAVWSEQLGRPRKALEHAARAVDAYRTLAAVDANHLPHLATALDVHAGQLAQHGRGAEAVLLAGEAVDIQRDLVDTDPETHRPNLANRLINQGLLLSQQGRYAEALPPTREAVEIYRDLIAADRPAHLPELATALANFGTRLAEVGRPSEALAPTEEAVDIRRELSEVNPAAHRADLAMVLNNYALRLAGIGRSEDALRIIEMCLAHYRTLAKRNPAAHRPDLARALHNYAIRLSALSRAEEALVASAEALTIYRALADNHPAVFAPDVALALVNHGLQLMVLKRGTEMLAFIEEALDRYRQLAERDPAVHLPTLAMVLASHGFALELCDRSGDAITSFDESAAVYRRLANGSFATYVVPLVRSLTEAASVRASSGSDLDRGVALAEEAIALLETADYPADLHTQTRQYLDVIIAHLLDALGRENEVEDFRRRLVR